MHHLTKVKIKKHLLKPSLSPEIREQFFDDTIDLYTFYLIEKFMIIDKKYFLPSQSNDNKGKKGELLLCGIIDLTMWALGFQLGQGYSVIHQFGPKGGNTIDFKLTCFNTDFLCEAKNWYDDTYVDEDTYKKKIKTRFFCNGTNILMILTNKVDYIEKWYKKHSTDNEKPINYIRIGSCMGVLNNDINEINANLLLGVNQMLDIILKETGIGKDIYLMKCLQIGMPTRFIAHYLGISEKKVNRKAVYLGYKRRSASYRRLVKYRDIR